MNTTCQDYKMKNRFKQLNNNIINNATIKPLWLQLPNRIKSCKLSELNTIRSILISKNSCVLPTLKSVGLIWEFWDDPKLKTLSLVTTS